MLFVVDADGLLKTLPAEVGLLQKAAVERDADGFGFFFAPETVGRLVKLGDGHLHRDILS